MTDHGTLFVNNFACSTRRDLDERRPIDYAPLQATPRCDLGVVSIFKDGNFHSYSHLSVVTLSWWQLALTVA